VNACLSIHYDCNTIKSKEDSSKMAGDRAFAAISSRANYKNRVLSVDFQIILD
jgi:hypothetical protein